MSVYEGNRSSVILQLYEHEHLLSNLNSPLSRSIGLNLSFF